MRPELIVMRSDELLTFEISDEHGFEEGTTVTVTFASELTIDAPGEKPRPAGRRGPFRLRAGENANPARGRFAFTEPGSFACGAVDEEPERGKPVIWKYDVSWTGLSDLDPRVKIEKGG